MIKIKNYINGELVEPASGNYLDNIEPATGQVYSQVAAGGEEDVERAVAAAEKAFPLWSGASAADRSDVMLKIADLIEKRLEEFVRAESIDNGKPLSLARSVDIPRAAKNFRFLTSLGLPRTSASSPRRFFMPTLRRTPATALC